jgi:hypothetical protein
MPLPVTMDTSLPVDMLHHYRECTFSPQLSSRSKYGELICALEQSFPQNSSFLVLCFFSIYNSLDRRLDHEIEAKRLAQFELDKELAQLQFQQQQLDPTYVQRHYHTLVRKFQQQLEEEEEKREMDLHSARTHLALNFHGNAESTGNESVTDHSDEAKVAANGRSVSAGGKSSIPRYEILYAQDKHLRIKHEQQKKEWDWQRLNAEGCTFAPHISHYEPSSGASQSTFVKNI